MLSIWSGPNFVMSEWVKKRKLKKKMPAISTPSQTTNFLPFQTERVCRRQYQTWRKWLKVFQTSNFSFSYSVFKRLALQTRKNQGLFGKSLTHYQTTNDSSKLKEFADDNL